MSALRLHLSDAEHAWFDREEREIAKPRRAADRTDALVEQIEGLEARLYFRGVLLEAALELLDKRAREHARTLELVAVITRCDELLAEHAGKSVTACNGFAGAGREAA